MSSFHSILLLVCAATLGCHTHAGQTGPSVLDVSIRGVTQKIHAYPARNGGKTKACVLFAPGDGGWRGFAIDVAEEISSWGHDVYGLDTKEYLSAFTNKSTLSEADVAGDVRTVVDAVCSGRRVILIGWSEGAGLMTLAAAAPLKGPIAGLITMGLSDRNVLGWRLVDNLSYITRRPPNEPTFSALAHLPKVSPLPLVMVQSANDEYVSRNEANRLFNAASEPKRFTVIDAQNHRFDGARDTFFQRLGEAVSWITAAPASR